MQLHEWFDDLAARFLLNLPLSEISSLPRFCFQVEEAQWYYEDFVRPLAAAAGQQLPNLPLRQFSLLMFQHCPIWNDEDPQKLALAYDAFLQYKVRVPVRGAILLDEKMEKLVLVKGYKKGANWSFPRGKINRDEDDLDCAIREVYEETGYDIRGAGLVAQPEGNNKYIDITMREQHMRMFVFRGVPLDTHFEPQTRKEISKVEFYKIRDLPGYRKKNAEQDLSHDVHQANKFYMVAPFLGPLKKWIGQQRRSSGYVSTDAYHYDTTGHAGEETDDGLTYVVPEASNEEKSEALRKLLSIGAVSQADLSPVVLDPNTFDRATPQPPLQTQQPPISQQQAQQKASLLSLFQSPQPPQAAPVADRRVPTQLDQFGFPVQQPLNGFPQQQHIQAFQAQPPAELSAASPQRTRHTMPFSPPQVPIQQPQMQNNAANRPPTGPSIDQLAPPKRMLLSLLSAPKPASTLPSPSTVDGRRPSEQASKLLDLLKAPSAVTSPAPVELSSDNAVQLPNSVQQARPEPVQQRKSTISEFTRTLPTKAKKPIAPATSNIAPPPVKKAPVAELKSQPVPHSINYTHRDEPLFTHKGPRTKHTIKAGHAQGSQITPPLDYGSKQANESAKARNRSSKVEPTPLQAFTILTRPESQKERAVTPSTRQTPTTILARNGPTAQSPTVASAIGSQPDKLLALFGSKPSHSAAKQVQQALATEESKVAAPNMKDIDADIARLGFLDVNATAAGQDRPALPPGLIPIVAPTKPHADVPKAPSLQPEQHPTKILTTPQHSLLDLFKKNTGLHQSPETPISPFALGSPEVLRRQQPSFPQARAPENRSQNTATPTESRGFLLNYLNGVVQKEGK